MNEAALRRPVDDAPPSPPPAPAVSYNTPGITEAINFSSSIPPLLKIQ